MYLIAWLWDVMREAAVLLAACGIAWWAWDQRRTAGERRDMDAQRHMEDERSRADHKAWREAMLADAAQRTARDAAADVRAGLKVRIHRLLHTTSDPFLSFAEIATGLAVAPASGDAGRPADDDIRRALIELIAERAVAQMEGDRYFVGSEFEADDETAASQG